jgi:hypothetical protein
MITFTKPDNVVVMRVSQPLNNSRVKIDWIKAAKQEAEFLTVEYGCNITIHCAGRFIQTVKAVSQSVAIYDSYNDDIHKKTFEPMDDRLIVHAKAAERVVDTLNNHLDSEFDKLDSDDRLRFLSDY